MATTFNTIKNWATSTLALAIGTDALSITVATGEGALFGSTFPMILVLDYNLPSNREVVKATNRVSNTFTIIRAQEGTLSSIHAVGTSVRCNFTAGQLSDVHTAINAIETDLTIPRVDNAIEKALLTPIYGKVCFQLDTGTFEICTEEA
jgi:hypothetical protein